VGCFVLDDSSQNVLLPFLWHSKGCTLDFLSDEALGRMEMEKLFNVIPYSFIVIARILMLSHLSFFIVVTKTGHCICDSNKTHT
jgi:hypothetical protein